LWFKKKKKKWTETQTSLRGINEFLINTFHIYCLLDKMWYKMSKSDAMQVKGKADFSLGHKWNYIYVWTVKHSSILKVKNILEKHAYQLLNQLSLSLPVTHNTQRRFLLSSTSRFQPCSTNDMMQKTNVLIWAGKAMLHACIWFSYVRLC